MGFSGSLQTLHFAEILQWCKSGGKTGTLTVGRKDVKKEVYFEKGMIVSAGSNDPREYLGQYLISLGKINEEQLKQAFEVQKRSKILLGKILVLRKLISQEDLEEVLRTKITEMIFNIFLWQTGKFHFNDRKLSAKDRRVQVEMDTDGCILEGARRVDEWKRFRAVFPNDRMVLSLGEKRPKDLGKDPHVAKILQLVEEGKTIGEMSLELRTSSFSLLSQLFELHRAGHVTARREKRGPRKAESSAREKRFKNEEEELIHLYRKALPPAKVPALLMELDALRTHPLTSEEAFVVSRINGRWDVNTIVMICPIKELEILRILSGFLDDGILGLR